MITQSQYDKDLMLKVSNDDEAAFKILFNKYKHPICNYIIKTRKKQRN